MVSLGGVLFIGVVNDNDSNNRFSFAIETSSGSYVNVQGGTPTVSNWHFIVCTYDGSNIKLYVDGSYIGQTAASGNIVGPAGATYLGAYNKAGDHYLNGKIDEVSIWNSALSSNEVSALYNSGNGLPQTQILGIILLQIIYNYTTISMKALVLHLQTSPPIVIMEQ